MTRKIKISELSEFDMTKYLPDEQAVALAHGMTEIAKSSGLTREALYRALRADAQPRFDTIARVCKTLGVKLIAQPMHS